MNRRRRRTSTISNLKNPIKLVCIIVSSLFFIIQMLSLLRFTTISASKKAKFSSIELRSAKFGKFGKSLIEMLPEDLAFTLFLPSEEAIQRDLRLNSNDSNSYAILTRVLGFSAVPRWISSADIEQGKERIYDSVSGFKLYVSKGLDGDVIVNGVVAEEMDLRMGNVVVHIMDGVVMDAEFAESMRPEEEDDDGLGEEN